LRPPRLGLLDYMLKGFDPGGERDLVFIPVGINYDRVLEDRTLLRKLDPAAAPRGVLYAVTRLAAFAASHLWLVATGRWFRFGYACVNFGTPISMRERLAAGATDLRQLPDVERHEEVGKIGASLMEAIARIIPVLPVSLVAAAVLRSRGAGLAEIELKSAAYDLILRLEQDGAHLYVPRGDLDYAIGVGLRMLLLRRAVVEQEGLYRADPAQRPLLEYYANAIGPALDRAGVPSIENV